MDQNPRNNNERLNELFKELRRSANVVARRNFRCCNTCASEELNEVAKERNKRGVVYYHRQDNDSLKEGGEYVMLGYGATNAEGISISCNSAESFRIGVAIQKAARKVGLSAKWNGDVNMKIEIQLPGGLSA